MMLLARLIIGLSLVLQLQLLCRYLYIWSCDTLLTNLDNVALHKVHLFSVFLVLGYVLMEHTYNSVRGKERVRTDNSCSCFVWSQDGCNNKVSVN